MTLNQHFSYISIILKISGMVSVIREYNFACPYKKKLTAMTRVRCDNTEFFVRIRRLLLTWDTIDISCLAYSNFCEKK